MSFIIYYIEKQFNLDQVPLIFFPTNLEFDLRRQFASFQQIQFSAY